MVSILEHYLLKEIIGNSSLQSVTVGYNEEVKWAGESGQAVNGLGLFARNVPTLNV